MPLNPNIIMSGQAPQINDPLEVMQRAGNIQGMALRNRAAQMEMASAEAQAESAKNMKALLQKHVTTGEDGSSAFNAKGAISDLYKADPEQAMKFKKMIDGYSLDELKHITEVSKILAWSVMDDGSNYGQILQKAREIGIPNAEKLPQQFIPGFVDKWKMSTLEGEKVLAHKLAEAGQKQKTAQLGLDQQNKNREFGLKDRELALKEKMLGEKSAVAKGKGAQEGIKALDKDYAKDYNDFTTSGAIQGQKSIEKLKEIVNQMKEDQKSLVESGGGRLSALPDFMRSRKSVAWRDNARTAANATLKSLFGGQLSDGERKAAAEEFYNDKLGNEENIQILEQKIAQMEDKYSNEVMKAQYFEKNGTLAGFAGAYAPSSKMAGANKFKQVESLPDDELIKLFQELGGGQ